MDKKLSKIISKLHDLEISFIDEKIKFMNHPKIVEYLFNKPSKKCEYLYNLQESCYNNTIKYVQFENQFDPSIEQLFLTMLEKLFEYCKYYKLYLAYLKKFIITSQKCKKFSPKLPIYDTNTIKVINIINDLQKEYNVDVIYKWNFKIPKREHTNFGKKIPINFTQNFVYDFLGVLFNKNKLIMFVIDFENSDDDITKILKQYFLFQMNIHLLRLEEKFTERIVERFVKKISRTNDYTIYGKILEKMDDIQKNKEMIVFNNDYMSNHIAYLKNPRKNEIILNKKFDIEYDEDPKDQGIKIDGDNFNKIKDKKIILTNTSQFDDSEIEDLWKDNNKKISIPLEIFRRI